MTFLPPSRVKSPVCEAIVLILVPLMASPKPAARSLAGAEPGRSLEDDHLGGRAAVLLGGPLAGGLALLLEVVADPAGEQRVRRRRRAVLEDDRDLRGLGLVEDVVPAVADDRCDDDRVDALADEAAHRRDLRGRVVVGGVERRGRSRSSLENAFFIDSVFALRQPDSEPVWANPTLIGPAARRCWPPWLLAAARGATTTGRDHRQGPQQGDTGKQLLLHARPPRLGPARRAGSVWDGAPSAPDVSPHNFRMGRMLSITFW